MVQAENFNNKIQPDNSVAKQLDSEAKKKAEQNRKLFKPTIRTVLFLKGRGEGGRQNL